MTTAPRTCDPPPRTEPLRFDRRRHHRWRVPGAATAFRLAGERFGERHELRDLDYSQDGLGAISPSVLEPGTIVSIGFRAPGYPGQRGVVLRCLPCGEGYRVAVQFELRLAA